MNWRDWWAMTVRRLLGRPEPHPPERPHFPAVHEASAELMIQAAELERLKQTPAYQRLQAEADLRKFEQARQGQRREGRR